MRERERERERERGKTGTKRARLIERQTDTKIERERALNGVKSR